MKVNDCPGRLLRKHASAVDQAPHDQEVMGSNSTGALDLIFLPSSQLFVPELVPREKLP